MTQVILINCSSIDVVPIFIINIVIEKEEVKELEWLGDLSSFDILIDDPKCELVLELASKQNRGTYPQSSFVLKGIFPLL